MRKGKVITKDLKIRKI